MSDIAKDILLAFILGFIIEKLPKIASWVVMQSAAFLPKRVRKRYEEEWLAELYYQEGGISKFVFAIKVVLNIYPLLLSVQNAEDKAERSIFEYSLFNIAFVVFLFGISCIILSTELIEKSGKSNGADWLDAVLICVYTLISYKSVKIFRKHYYTSSISRLMLTMMITYPSITFVLTLFDLGVLDLPDVAQSAKFILFMIELEIIHPVWRNNLRLARSRSGLLQASRPSSLP